MTTDQQELVDPPPPLKGRWHSASWWTSVGGITAVIALVVGLGAWWFPKSPSQPVAAEPDSHNQPAGDGGQGSPTPIIATVAGSNDSSPDCGGRGYLLANGLDQLAGTPDPPDELAASQALNDWFVAHGATEVINNVSVTIEGPHTSAAILTGMTPVIDRRAPATGAVVGYWQCGGQLTQRVFTADLAKPTPSLEGYSENPAPGQTAAPPASFPFTISATDPEVFSILMKRPPGEVIWHLEIAWTLNGVSGTTRVPATGGFHSTDAPFYGVYPAREFLNHPRSYSNGTWVS